jgi:hypothetical protein
MSQLEPRVWSSFETTKNGQKYKIRIERVTPDLLEDAIQHMVSYFLEREPITKYNRKYYLRILRATYLLFIESINEYPHKVSC